MNVTRKFAKRRFLSFSISGLVLLLFLCLAPGPASALGSPAPSSFKAQHLTVNLVPLTDTVSPGGKTQVGLHFVLEKDWHVYWINAGDAGLPPKVDWTLPKGVSVGPLQFPAPERLPVGPLMDFGYQNEVLFPMDLEAASNMGAPSEQQLQARVNWLVCREVCIPGKASLALPLHIAHQQVAPRSDVKALFQRFESRMPQPFPPSAEAKFQTTPTEFKLAILNFPGGVSPQLKSAEFFPLDQYQIDNPAPQKVLASKNGVEIVLRKAPDLEGNPQQLNGLVRLGDGSSYIVHAAAGSVPTMTAAAVPAGGPSGGFGLPRYLLLAFVGGMILNLMPCVFPVLFIKGLALVEASSETRLRLRRHGYAYTLGILVSFWVVAGLLLGLRAAGSLLGWGFQFQSPGFIAVIALLLFFLGLSLAGMFEVGLTATSAGSGLAQKGGYAGSFFTGVLAMVVATPCAAPFMGVAIGFALAAPAAWALLIFTALGLGLAAPYLLLTLEPAWTRWMPRPGAWMEMVRRLAAIPIFATVIWLVWLFTQSAGATLLPALLAAFLLLAIAGWVLGHWPQKKSASSSAALVIALAVAVPLVSLALLPGSPAASSARAQAGEASSAADQAEWQPYSEAALARYRAEGKPVFVDFTAAWCLSCQVNQKVVLDRGDVQRRLHSAGVVLMRADWTHRDAEISRAIQNLGRSGVPVYALYLPGRPVKLLPAVLTPGIIFDALQPLEANLQN